jgi:hypothetical protein
MAWEWFLRFIAKRLHKESARNTGSLWAWSGTTNRTPVTAQATPWGTRQQFVYCFCRRAAPRL